LSSDIHETMVNSASFLAVMIADANRVSARNLQSVLEAKPYIAKVEVFNHPGTARRAFRGAGFNCLFVDIYSLGVDAGIELIQHVETTCPEAPICLYSDSSSLITMSDVSQTWRNRFGHYFKLGKDQLTPASEAEVDTLVGSLAAYFHKAVLREKASGQTVLVEPPPPLKPSGPTRLVEPPPPQAPEPAGPSPDAVKETTTDREAAASDWVFETAVRKSSRPMLSRVEYGIEVLAPAPRTKTGRAFDITGTYTSLPAGHHIWVSTVEERRLQGPDALLSMARQYRPLEEATAKAIRTWYAHVENVGGKTGDLKTIAIAVVGRNGQVLFDYFKRASSEARKLLVKKTTKGLADGSYDRLPPLPELTDDVVECATLLVVI
jgi:hypothetical protein